MKSSSAKKLAASMLMISIMLSTTLATNGVSASAQSEQTEKVVQLSNKPTS